MKNSVMFLLGSGSSIPGGFPSTSEITSQIFAGSNIVRHTDSRYYLKEDPLNEIEKHWTEDYLPNVLTLLKSIQELMESYDKDEPLNYEILYYFLQQLYDYESGDYLNMALYPFIEQVKKKMPRGSRAIDLFREAENYIRHTVWRMLQKTSTDNHSHLNFLSDAINDQDMALVNMATLNHDGLIEKNLAENKVHFQDGFSSSDNGVRYWVNNFGERNNLLKIHGSVDWFTLHPDDGDWFDDKVGIVLDGDIDHPRSPGGQLMMSLPEKEPYILVGTFNKIYEYTEGILSSIYYQFRNLLNKSKCLVITGYSFGDKGINTAIIEWLYSDRQNKIIIIHPNMDNLLRNAARSAITKSYTGMAKKNFINIPKYIQESSWKEIKSVL